MTKERRVGTMTTGLSLVAFGVLFLLRLFIPGLDCGTILSLWPLILISMGVELMLYNLFSEETHLKMDVGSIFLLFLLGIFSFSMAGFEVLLEYIKFLSLV